jgi:hypothetical protein
MAACCSDRLLALRGTGAGACCVGLTVAGADACALVDTEDSGSVVVIGVADVEMEAEGG